MNCVLPVPGFLEALRSVCDQHGSVLIFDEVMTGFRVALGGAQALYGIKPDLTTLGKIVGGGMPVGAFGGRREIMERIAPLGSGVPGRHAVGKSGRDGGGRWRRSRRSARRVSTQRLAEKTTQLIDGLNARGTRRRRAIHDQSRVRNVRPVLHRQDAGALLPRSHGVRRGALQAFLPRHADRGHLPGAVGVRSRLRFGGALALPTSTRRSRQRGGRFASL